jgi:hypothetical protein
MSGPRAKAYLRFGGMGCRSDHAYELADRDENARRELLEHSVDQPGHRVRSSETPQAAMESTDRIVPSPRSFFARREAEGLEEPARLPFRAVDPDSVGSNS